MSASLERSLHLGGLTNEDLVASLVDTDIGIYIDNPIEGCTYVNDALRRMTGRSWEEIQGFGWANCVHPEDVELLRAAVARFEQERGSFEVRYRLVHPDGQVRDVRSRVRAIVDANGVHRGTIAYVTDETEHRTAAERSVQSQKLETIGRMASRIAHDFNNYLSAVLTASELLTLQDLEDDGVELVSIIKHAVEHASILTSQLLGLTRQQVGQNTVARIDRELAAFAPFVQQVIGEAVQLTVDLRAGDKSVALAAHQVSQVVLNLAVNARDAGAAHILLSTAEAENYVELSISDDGSGVPEAIRSQMFEPFFTTKPVGQGTGLGLATVSDLVARAGGEIALEDRLGGGTIFKLTLPVAAEPVRLEPDAPVQDVPGGARVLLVEDNDALRQSLAIAIGLAGHHVQAAADVKGAHARLAESPFDVVVSDVMLPDGVGPELMELTAPGTGFILMSGFSGDEVAQPMLDSRGVEFLQKPFNPRVLMLTIDRLRNRGNPSLTSIS